jgi:hypothetical protein
MPAFHVYPSSAQAVDQAPNLYSRSIPLQANVVEFDTINGTGKGYYDPANFCYVALVPQIMRFHAHLLFQTPRDGGIMNVWFMKNTLPPPDGSVGGEMCGDDAAVYQKAGYGANNQSCRVTRLMRLNAGDRVWCVPGFAGGGALTNSVAGNGNNTVNYFEGDLIELL